MIEELYLDALQVMSPTGPLTNYHVNGFTGIGSPPPRSNRPVRGRRQGSFELTSFYDPREFTATVWVWGVDGNGDWNWDNFWPALEALKDAVSLSSFTRTITFRRAGNPYGIMEMAYVTPEGEIEPRFPHGGTPAAEVEITLIAADPRLYSSDMSTHTGSGSFSIINGGTFNTPPIITLTGGGSPIITNNSLTTQNRLRIIGAGGGTVVINARDQTVTLNGSSAPEIFDAENSWFWGLTAGVNNISVSGATATIDWADARI